jgi:hypothetical protein
MGGLWGAQLTLADQGEQIVMWAPESRGPWRQRGIQTQIHSTCFQPAPCDVWQRPRAPGLHLASPEEGRISYKCEIR